MTPFSQNVDRALKEAVTCHKSCKFGEAERIYRSILQEQPNQPDANHNLGVLAVQNKEPLAGLPHLKMALEANPDNGQYWISYIDALIRAGQKEAARRVLGQGRQRGLKGEAVEALVERLEARDSCVDGPSSPPTPAEEPVSADRAGTSPYSPALEYREAGRYKEAIEWLQTWLISRPQDAEAHAHLAHLLCLNRQDEAAWVAMNNAMAIHSSLPVVQRNLARLLLKQRKSEEAFKAASCAWEAEPNEPENQLVLAATLGAKGENGKAMGLVESALQSRPGYAEAYAGRALLKMRVGDSAGALQDVETSLSIKPHLSHLWGMVGSLRYQLKDLPGAIEAMERALVEEPDNVMHMMNLGEFKRRVGAMDAAIALLEKALSISPENAEGWVNLGTALQQSGRMDEAKTAYRKSLAIKPDQVEVANNLGVLALREEKWTEALHYFEEALAFEPSHVVFMTNSAIALHALGRHQDAEHLARKAMEADPMHVEAGVTLCRALISQKFYEKAGAALDAVATKPDNVPRIYRLAEAHCNLGATLQGQRRLAEAEVRYRRALEIKPDCVEALNKLASMLNSQGEPGKALDIVCRSLQVKETWKAKNLFVECIKRLRLVRAGSDSQFSSVRGYLTRALCETWCRPKYLAQTGAEFLKLSPDIGECVARAAKAWPRRLSAKELFGDAVMPADALMCALLDSGPILDIDLERFLTMARRIMLDAAAGMTACGEGELDFYGALARQCFINEYVFSTIDEESGEALKLRRLLESALAAGKDIPALWPVAVAAYFPLHSLPLSDLLLDRKWPETVGAVLAQQVREPREEWQLRLTVPHLTAIEDEISLLVQNQYEENPYPRWVRVPSFCRLMTIDDFLSGHFHFAGFKPLGKRVDTDILIAGCGTGQQSIETAQLFQGARILAVDLSLTSLCYAKRKTRETGVTTIEYAQADILKLGSLDRRFDLIVSSGVLHHLADPLAGWRVLLSLLRPGGFMKLGLYSEVARREIVRARAFIAEQGYGPTAEDIRRCRQELLNSEASTDFGAVLTSPDFFSISACRDLLFHVQEHRLTLAGIGAFIRDNDLRFLGFEIDPHVLQTYKRRFQDDPAATNLSHWKVFECENPDTFAGMYQFWVQRAGR